MESAALSRDLSHRFFMAARGIGVLDFTARGFTPVSFSLIFFSSRPPCLFSGAGRASIVVPRHRRASSGLVVIRL